MKNDRYLKIILTIIAICLVWICVRDIKIGGNYLFAGQNGISGETEVYVTGGNLDYVTSIHEVASFASSAFYYAEPISVTIDRPIPEPEEDKE